MNIYSMYPYSFTICFQQTYHLDSFIEYVGIPPTIVTRENQVQAHYICYQYMNNTFVRFDDAIANRLELDVEYSVNLLFYRKDSTDTMTWDIDLDRIPMARPLDTYVAPVPKVVQPLKPDVSLRPPLITVTTSKPVRPKSPLKPETPTRQQPSRASKSTPVYEPASSDESSDPPDSGEEYKPPVGNKGQCTPSNISS